MASSSSIVVKVKYEDILRRFTTQIADGKLVLNMSELKEKIRSFFNFGPGADISLTYIDEDNDTVNLVNDDDLHDAVQQALNPLRITVKLNSDVNGKKHIDTNGKLARDLGDTISAVVSEHLDNVHEPLRGMLSQISNDLASNLSSIPPGPISELVDHFSKAGISYLGKHSGNQPSQRDPSTTENTPPQFSDFSGGVVKILSEVMTEVSSKGKEKFQTGMGGNMPSSSATANGAVGAENTNFAHPSSVCPPVQTKSDEVGDAGREAHEPSAPSSIQFPFDNWLPIPAQLSGSSYRNGPPFGCPFSGIPVNDECAAPTAQLWKHGFGNNGKCIHRGIRCDGCGAYPIVGPRYKSNVKHDYDLCSTCFDKEGNDNDYTRMDLPGVYFPQFKGHHDGRGRHRAGLHQRLHRGCKAKNGAVKLDSRFIMDVNVFDGTVMPPLTSFTKIWRMRNNGSVAWPPKTQLVWLGGDKLSHANVVEVEIPSAGLPVDQELDVAVDFVSPTLPGRYVSYWRMASPFGQKFGQRVWVLIQVDASANESPNGSVRDLNLNMPPLNPGDTLQVVPETGGTAQEPPVLDSHSKTDRLKKMVNVEEEAPVDPKANNFDQELQFPINNTLLVGDGASTSAPPPVTPSAPYPIIDLSDVRAPSPTGAPENIPQKPDEEPGALEEMLLKELDEMGFEHIDLNKEVLRMKEYDMEQTVDQLCGASDWDPLLEELQEMGFHDKDLNKKLLEKNNGSIQRVVLDLVAGERA